MKPWKLATFAAVMSFGLGVAADAKPLSRIISEMGLTPADFEVVNATADQLLTGSARAGDERSWVNDATGSKGTIRVRDVRGNCVHLQHFIQPEGAESSREVRTRRCKDASGNWILTP